MSLTVPSVVIVGSNSEIGTWINEFYVSLGIDVIRMSRKDDADYKYTSLCDLSQLQDIFRQIHKSVRTLDTIYYCPGFIGNHSLQQLQWEDWKAAIDVNLNGLFCMYRALFDSGILINVLKIVVLGSTAIISRPKNNAAYASSKIALETLVSYINNESPASVRACCIRLGRCSTDFASSGKNNNFVSKDDMMLVVKHIHEARIETMPELITIRPIV